MQIIVDIPDEIYEVYKIDSSLSFLNEEQQSIAESYLISRFINGIRLPKVHGRLMILSEDKLKENQINFEWSCQKWITEVGISNATVAIIEEDKTKSEE